MATDYNIGSDFRARCVIEAPLEAESPTKVAVWPDVARIKSDAAVPCVFIRHERAKKRALAAANLNNRRALHASILEHVADQAINVLLEERRRRLGVIVLRAVRQKIGVERAVEDKPALLTCLNDQISAPSLDRGGLILEDQVLVYRHAVPRQNGYQIPSLTDWAGDIS
jgi:hypothetical protein